MTPHRGAGTAERQVLGGTQVIGVVACRQHPVSKELLTSRVLCLTRDVERRPRGGAGKNDRLAVDLVCHRQAADSLQNEYR